MYMIEHVVGCAVNPGRTGQSGDDFQ